jgi:hypothetical protein
MATLSIQDYPSLRPPVFTLCSQLDFIHLLVSPRRDAAEEYVKSTRKADFTYFPSAENKGRFGDYFSKSKWIKSSSVIATSKK